MTNSSAFKALAKPLSRWATSPFLPTTEASPDWRSARPRKIYIHINNTNPMLNEAGPEYRQVREAGWEIAEDGWQFDL